MSLCSSQGNSKGAVFPCCPRIFHSYLDFLNPIGQCRTFETLKIPKQNPEDTFRLVKPKVLTAKSKIATRCLESLVEPALSAEPFEHQKGEIIIKFENKWLGLGSSVSYQCHGLLRKLSKVSTLAPKYKSFFQISLDQKREKYIMFFL